MIKKTVHTEYRDTATGISYKFEPVEDSISLKSIERIIDVGDDQERREQTEPGFELRYLTADENPMSPDEWGDDYLFLVHYHRNFLVENRACTESTLGYIMTKNDDEYDKDGAEQVLKDYHVFPVAAYIHSGIRLSLRGDEFPDQQWDVSHVGAILASRAEFKKRSQAHQATEGLLKQWNQYLSGEVFCCVKETLDKDKKQVDFDVVGGFYGFKYAKECLKTEF